MPPLALRFSERRILLEIADFLILTAALWIYLHVGDGTGGMHVSWIVTLLVVWFTAGAFLNVYDLAKAASPMHSLWSASGAVLLTAGLYLLIPYLTPPLPERRLNLLLFPAMAVAGVAAWRLTYAKVFAQPAFHQTALVVGAGWSGRTLAQVVSFYGDGHVVERIVRIMLEQT